MELQCKLLLYLDRRGYLEDMKSECEKFSEIQLNDKTTNKFPPLRFFLEIDFMDIVNKFPDVGELLLKEPMKWRSICIKIMYECLHATNEEFAQSVQLAQVAVMVRVKCLSKLVLPPNPRHYSGLVAFEGILTNVSKPENYVYHTVWSCPEECEGSEVILHYFPKVSRKCYVCKSVLFENCGLRRCGEQVKATFKMDNSFSAKDFNIVDDLIPRLQNGCKYAIHAVVTKKLTVVWSLEKIDPLPAPITSPVPKDVLKLFQKCEGVPWKFIYCLASSIGYSICPLNCFMHLKISLLMSLSSVKANMFTDSDIVHVLAAGFDTGYVGDIMTVAARLAGTAMFLGTSNTEVSTTLWASSGGVCVMPLPLHFYNKKQIDCILAAVESGEVTTDTGKTTLRSAVWAQGMEFKKNNVFNVASVFGTLCRGDLDEYKDEIVDFIVERAIEPFKTSDDEEKALKDVALYIDLVAGIKVIIDDLAETVLQNYFLSARKEGRRYVSAGSMNALVANCVTSARLCRRTVANVDDAVLAIWLHISGSPEPRFAPEEYLQTPSDVIKLSKMMNSFKKWLEEFTGIIFSVGI